jgi:phosphatidate cytidylyltransferase
MIIRAISAIVMATFMLTAVNLGTPYFEILIIFVGIVAIIEWYQLILAGKPKLLNIVFMSLGAVYIIVPCLIMVWLRNNSQFGFYFVMWFLIVIWSTDIGAYVFGRSIGGLKLAPQISPNKTWSGFFGGVISAITISVIFKLFLYPQLIVSVFVFACVFISVIGQIGDLFESWCKRKLGVKDTGNIIPGHGGVLDRVDSILLSAPMAGLLAIISQIYDISWK